MARSTKADKARQLNAAYAMLQRDIPLPEAMQHLSREFDLSERQAYRYLEEAAHLDRPVEVRSEERRVGKEGRFRWSPYHSKKRKTRPRRPTTARRTPDSISAPRAVSPSH